MKYQNIIIPLSTLGPCGYCTGSGTLATLITLPFALALRMVLSPLWYGCFVLLLALGAFFIINQGLNFFSQSDPSQIVIDEVVGCFIAFFALPLTSFTIVGAFLFFRIFDIAKCCGVQACESFDGAWGVLMDDVAAGILANIMIRYIYYQLPL